MASPCCPLLAALQSDGGDSAEVRRNVEDIVVKIINVFVDALPHVPEPCPACGHAGRREVPLGSPGPAL